MGRIVEKWLWSNCRFAQPTPSGIPKISQQEAMDRGFFGPVYHGTTQENMQRIIDEGFKIFEGEEREGNIRHGYPDAAYGATGFPPPIHHLGYGIYFTTVKNIGKKFNEGTTSGLKMFYLNIPRMETINFGSPNTMMKWWIKNGYDPKLAKEDRVAATKVLTQNLASSFDAVWYRGKGLYRLLDGDQICVFDPKNIFMVEKSISKPGDIGSKVKRNIDGMTGIITGVYLNKQKIDELRKRWEETNPNVPHWIKPETTKVLHVKWKKGGTDMNVQDSDIIYL